MIGLDVATIVLQRRAVVTNHGSGAEMVVLDPEGFVFQEWALATIDAFEWQSWGCWALG